VSAPLGTSWAWEAHRLLAGAVSYADDVLYAVTPALLSRPTPCRAWDLRTLLEHAEESIAILHEGVAAHRIGVSPVPAPRRPPAGAAPLLVAAVRQRAAALLQASVGADGDLPVTVGGYPMPFDCLCTTGALEITVHAWDISQACGQHLPIPDDQAAGLLAQARRLVPRLDREPMFAAPASVPAGSALSDRLAAYLGRAAGWEAS
jgi:uncharacterized protein (TIGR03086 family)